MSITKLAIWPKDIKSANDTPESDIFNSIDLYQVIKHGTDGHV